MWVKCLTLRSYRLLNFSDYRITECLSLEVTYGDHLVQSICSKRSHSVQFTQGFDTSNTEDSDTSLVNLLLCSTSHSHITKHISLCSNGIATVLCICIDKILLSFCSPGRTVPALSVCTYFNSKSQLSFAGLILVCHDFYTGECWDRPSPPECKVQITKFINILSCNIVTLLGLFNQLSYK